MRKFKNILVYVNTHSDQVSALEEGLQLASENRARIVVADVVGQFPLSPRSQEIRDMIIEEKRERLSELRDRVKQSDRVDSEEPAE